MLAYVSCEGDLVYGGRYGPNHLRLLDLETREDRLLVADIGYGRGIWERFTFTNDSDAVVIGFGGKLHKIEVGSGKDNVIPFRANAIVDIAPKVYSRHRIESDVTVRGVASADLSPDGSNIIFSALSHLFMTTCEDEDPDLLTDQDAGQFQPVYAPNGKSIRSEEQPSELQSLMRISYAVF